MGPKKEAKKDVQKRDQSVIDEPLNTDYWRCVVVMAVEKSSYDSFVLKEFMEEYSNGRRQEIGLIDFDAFVLKILNDFAGGNLPSKYSSLLHFSPVLQEANEFLTAGTDIPVPVLVRVVKALLFYLREESLKNIEKKAAGRPDPIAAMADRPANFGPVETKKKEPTKKTDNAPKPRPQSVTKADTRLLKRGEPVKDEQRIDDAPLNGYFNLYVLLTGFYHPDIPLELIKAGIPLHGLLCIDASASGMRRQPSHTRNKPQKYNPEAKAEDIQAFWDVFLKILWDTKVSPYFKDTIFQVYIPRSLRCDRRKLREFIYREISYLMYDLSDFKRQLNNYLDHMKLWDMEEKDSEGYPYAVVPESIPNECATAPLVLQCLIDCLCGKDVKYRLNLSSDSIGSVGAESYEKESFSLSAKAWFGSSIVQPNWSQLLSGRGDSNLMKVYAKVKQLDAKYDLDNRGPLFHGSERALFDRGSSATCDIQFPVCGENMQQALSADGPLRSYWKRYDRHVGPPFPLDYCLYPLLMSRVLCPYLSAPEPPAPPSTPSFKTSTFHLIDNIDTQMRMPHFTVTDSSRSILRAFPYNLKDASRDFFSPTEFKVVSPEKLKASSAPQFRLAPRLKVRAPFTSQVFSREISRDLFENLREFLGEWICPNANGFHFLELLGQQQLTERKLQHWDSYNCVDHTYSILNDSIFVVLHNRMDGQNVHHETFNEVLKTTVGLRDFYEYVLEDESGWFAEQDKCQLLTIHRNKSSESRLPAEFSESEFWLANSIKFQERGRVGKKEGNGRGDGGAGGRAGSAEVGKGEEVGGGDSGRGASADFEGYNVSDMAVQYSGLKTVYYSSECSMAVELIERLYGSQDLGVHVTAGGHTLHLYSYVCPEPHILEPFTFHVTYRNGAVVAFSRRFIETLEEVEEVIESRTTIKGKKNSSELSTRVVRRMVPKTVRDEEFVYDMVGTLPNGLSVRTVRRLVKPCYIKQQHLDSNEDIARVEKSRLFLPNGSVVRMLSDDTVQVLKPDTSILTAALDHLVRTDDGVRFSSFHFVSSEGQARAFSDGRAPPPKRFQVLQNTDMATNQTFFRRRDGTNYLLQNDGALCVEFKDGTKISSSAFVRDGEEEGEAAGEDGGEYVFVYTRTVMEHPAYATVIFDSQTQRWTVLLPQDSTITVEPNGQYFVDVDKQTELRAEAEAVQMNRYSSGRRLACAATADLSVFEGGEGGVYCHMEDLKGKIFIVEANSNCYILDDERASEESEEGSVVVSSQQSEVSEFVASADLQSSDSVQPDKPSRLSRNNKYFVMKRDLTGFQLLHEEEVSEVLSEKKTGSLVFTETLPGTNNRLFVLLTPQKTQTLSKWQVDTILPKPVYVPNASKRLTSSTYGLPPSWTHPFPKNKTKFQLPDLLASRVFIETKKTNLSPPVGEIDCNFCEIELLDAPYAGAPPGGVEDHLARLANNDQDLLKGMYAVVAESLINEKKKLRPNNSDKLQHYLSLSRYYVDLQEYHKRCIRYHIVPNYFHHPAGMSWLILNHLLDRLRTPQGEFEGEVPCPSTDAAERLRPLSTPTTAFSYEEVEYNLPQSDAVSFSDLSYRSDLSAHTAPAALRTGGVCRCKLRPIRDAVSAPAVKCFWPDASSEDPLEPHPRLCDFHENEFQMLRPEGRHLPPFTLDDLMSLNLI